MDTTQKNREAALPKSAQQRNGAVRSAEDQRTGAGRSGKSGATEDRPSKPGTQQPRRKPASQAEQGAPQRKKAPEAKQEAPQRKKAPVNKQEAPQTRKQPAAKQEAPQRKKTPEKKQEKPQPKKQAAKSGFSLFTKTKKKEAAPAGQKKQSAGAAENKAPKSRAKGSAQKTPEYTQGLPDSVSTKKRAYGNSKPKKKTALDVVNDAVKRSGERKAEKIKQRQAEREKGVHKKPSQQVNAPAVIYTQPQAFNRSRFLVQMLTVTAVVVALVMGLSVFFKVEVITVSGAEVYSTWAVREASGIKEGANLLTFSHARAGAQIKANLPYVKSVRFGIKLPDTVNIMIEEEDVVYAIKTQDGTWWLMTSTGRMVEQTNSAVAAKYTQILGVTVTDPVAGERGVATESAAVYETNANGETVPVPVSVTGAQRLTTALQIVKALEDNDIVGDAASVDVTRLEDIILWYGTRYQVNLGNSTNLAYKITCMNDCILQMGEYQTGVLDISFTIWPNQVGFTPFG